MKRIERFKKVLSNYSGDIDFEILDSFGDVKDILTYIDVSKNIIKYEYYYMESCGCCDGIDSNTEKLDLYLEDMLEKDFNSLIEYIKRSYID